jgi:thioredoxin reductase
VVHKSEKSPAGEIFLRFCAGTRARLELFELLAENSEIVTKWNIRVKEILGKDISVTRLHITL